MIIFVMQADIQVIDDATGATALLDPVKRRVMDHLREPGSASSAAKALKLPRQRLGYHVKQLERAGLLKHVEDVRKGNCIERRLVATARRYVISPKAFGSAGSDLTRVRDKFSGAYLVALAGRSLAELGELRRGADAAGKKLSTLAVDSEVSFSSPATQAAFAEELAKSLAGLIAKYNEPDAEDHRTFRIVATAYPKPQGDDDDGHKDAND